MCTADTECAREIVELVLEAMAEAGGLERGALTARTPLLEANVDSLTLVAIIARLELALGVRFGDEESAALIEARDAHELCVIVTRRVRRSAPNLVEVPGFSSCFGP